MRRANAIKIDLMASTTFSSLHQDGYRHAELFSIRTGDDELRSMLRTRYSIPAHSIKDIMNRVDAMLDTNKGFSRSVLLGGRAVNALCRGEERLSPDIDIAVRIKGELTESRLNDLRAMAERMNFKPNGIMTKLTDRETGIKVDLFFKPAGSPETFADSKKADGTVSGVPVNEVLRFGRNTAVTVEGETSEARVVAPWQLIIMKYNAVVNDVEKADPHHKADLFAVIRHQYGSINSFVSKENKNISRYASRGYIGRNINSHDGSKAFSGDCRSVESLVLDLKRLEAE